MLRVASASSSTVATARAICSRNSKPSPPLEWRGSPQTPCGSARNVEPALVSKKAKMVDIEGPPSSGNGGQPSTARSSLTSSGLTAITAEVSPMFAWSPVARLKYASASSGGSASQYESAQAAVPFGSFGDALKQARLIAG